ncbi:MAG: glycosyltransferase [Candidatus Aureabacteria bacterium]|nr:glycosyltransferase [Candidatus Auribacterota bacterium]
MRNNTLTQPHASLHAAAPPGPPVEISVVIPIYNEEENIPLLHPRLRETMERLGRSYEVILIDDGSSDRSAELISGLMAHDPRLRLIEFNRNYGQHAAVFAGFEHARGMVIVTLDADLQNPPEEIPKLIAKIDEGYDIVGGMRGKRRDSVFRKIPSWLVNRFISRATGVSLRDYGCMLRAYHRTVVDQIVRCNEISSFIPTLANSFARSVTEIEVAHAERKRGKSKYNLRRLLKLNFDLVTGFSLFPIQLISGLGILIALLGIGFGIMLMVLRFVYGAVWAAQGVFTLFALLFVFVGIQLLAMGLIGEYIGRIYSEVRNRPRYVIKKISS